MATKTSIMDGNWSNPAIWGGSLPSASDTIDIDHNVVYDLSNDQNIYGRINVNLSGKLIHKQNVNTTLRLSKFLYIYGKYHMGAGHQVLFSGTSKTSSTEGAMVGIIARADYADMEFVLEGSVPMPETYLTEDTDPAKSSLTVYNASSFSVGDYISVYYDMSNDTSWNWNGKNFSDEGFIVHHLTGNEIFVIPRVGVKSQIAGDLVAGNNSVKVPDVDIWQVNMQVFIGNEQFTIAKIENDLLYFTNTATNSHTLGSDIVQCGIDKIHETGDKVYKLFTTVALDSEIGNNQISIVDPTCYNVGDYITMSTKEQSNSPDEYKIINKSGNVLTLNKPISQKADTGEFVIKTSRNCRVGVVDETIDESRCFVYVVYGSGANRKVVLRNCEINHFGNSSSLYYYGLCLRGDMSDTGTEAEIRGVSLRNGWMDGNTGIYLYLLRYASIRNCINYHSYFGIYANSLSGVGLFNNIYSSQIYGIYNNSIYYDSPIQYNIIVNSTYGLRNTSVQTASYPETQNIIKNCQRSLLFASSATGQAYGSFVKNKVSNTLYRQFYMEGEEVVLPELFIEPAENETPENYSVAYSRFNYSNFSNSLVTILNKNGKKDDFEIHNTGGFITKATNNHMGIGWSYKFGCNSDSYDLVFAEMIYFNGAEDYKITAYIYLDEAYMGQTPCLFVKGYKFNNNTELRSYCAGKKNVWHKVELSFRPEFDELLHIGIAGKGDLNNFYLDPRVVVSVPPNVINSKIYSKNTKFYINGNNTQSSGVSLGGISL